MVSKEEHLQLIEMLLSGHRGYYEKRPVMQDQGLEGLSNLIRRWVGEAGEINGGDEDGIFSHENIEGDSQVRANYLQEEASDLAIFGFSILDFFNKAPFGRGGADLVSILQKIETIAADFEVDLNDIPDDLEVIASVDAMFVRFEKLRDVLNGKILSLVTDLYGFEEEVDIFSVEEEIRGLKIEQVNVDDLISRVEEIIALSMVMQFALGVNSFLAIREKIFRNIFKYPLLFLQVSTNGSNSADSILMGDKGQPLTQKEVFALCKENYQNWGGDEWFYSMVVQMWRGQEGSAMEQMLMMDSFQELFDFNLQPEVQLPEFVGL